MATVWELIQEHSTAPPGSTFWEHLNAQEGGGGGAFSHLVLTNGLEVAMDDACVDVNIDLDALDVEVETPEYGIEIDTLEYDVEVC